MTRLLSDLLGAPQPGFAGRIKQLERASGDPGTDIRLSAEIMQRTQTKIRELGLDPHDTTGTELYIVLQQRLLADEQRLRDTLGLSSTATSSSLLASVLQFEQKLDLPRSCFALKSSVAKRLLKGQPPKKAMSRLGYRSIDSFAKHEPVASIYAAGLTYEASSWRGAFLQQYDHLTPSDFETRDIAVQYPRAHRWETAGTAFAEKYRHTTVVFKELGAVVMLPIETTMPAQAITHLLLLLQGINTIRTTSTYLKLQQVGPQFGSVIRQAVLSEPTTAADFAGQPLPWRVVQYYYHMVREAYHPALFEPHVQPDDLALVQAEAAIAKAIPALEFWQDTTGLAHVQNGQVVSLNMLDVALGVANDLAFDQRIIKHVREQVWSDVIVSYLRHRKLDALVEQLSGQSEPAGIEQGALL